MGCPPFAVHCAFNVSKHLSFHIIEILQSHLWFCSACFSLHHSRSCQQPPDGCSCRMERRLGQKSQRLRAIKWLHWRSVNLPCNDNARKSPRLILRKYFRATTSTGITALFISGTAVGQSKSESSILTDYIDCSAPQKLVTETYSSHNHSIWTLFWSALYQ